MPHAHLCISWPSLSYFLAVMSRLASPGVRYSRADETLRGRVGEGDGSPSWCPHNSEFQIYTHLIAMTLGQLQILSEPQSPHL